MEYRQLDHANFETRFLRYLGKCPDSSELVSLELVTASLSKPPTYSALSYHWGDPSITGPIKVDGITLTVSKNLCDFLNHAILEIGSYIWVDALCINQIDLYEKGVQLKLMGLIYSKAQRTFAWIGVAGPCTRHAQVFLTSCQHSAGAKQPGRDLFDSDTHDTVEKRLSRWRVHFTHAFGQLDVPTTAISGLYELIARPYWERVWILQEIAKAREVRVMCGNLQFDLGLLILASRVLSDVSSAKRSLFTALARFREQEQRNPSSTTPRLNLLQALMLSRNSRATDDRDKVYSLLGLAADASELVPIPTYTKDVQAVFKEVTAAIVQSGQRSDILLLSSWVSLNQRYFDSAPWVVDWANLPYGVPPWLNSPKALKLSDSAVPELTDDQLYTTGRLIGITTTQNVSFLELAAGHGALAVARVSSKASTLTDENRYKDALRVMKHITKDFLKRLCPWVCDGTLVQEDELTDALARMIRDADKSAHPMEYNLFSIQDVLLSLGQVSYAGDPVWNWARLYNDHRANTVPTPQSAHAGKTSRLWPFLGVSSGQLDRLPSLKPRSERPLPAAFRLWEELFKTLMGNFEFPLGFASVEDLGLVLVRKHKTQVGDAIYQLDNCHLPVVLQQTKRGTFYLNSEACLNTHSITGEWVSGADAVEELFKGREPPKLQKLAIELGLRN